MNDVRPESSNVQLSAKIDDLVLALKWLIGLFIILLTIPNFLLAMLAETFRAIFNDALPGKPLPGVTVAMLYAPALLRVITLLLPVLGLVNLIYNRSLRYKLIGSTVVLFLIGLQLVLMWMALFLPMVGLIVGMSDDTTSAGK